MSIEDEINEIEKYIETLDKNDKLIEERNSILNDGKSKGLIYDFFNVNKNYRGTILSSKVIKQEEYNEFQKYINRCNKEEYEKYKIWKQEIIDSGDEYSKDELKYNKLY